MIESLIKLVLAVVAVLWRGFVLKTLWGWYIAATFGIHQLSLIQAIGLSIVVSLLTTTVTNNDLMLGLELSKSESKKKEVDTMGTVVSFLVPLFALISGWIYHFFM